MTLYQKYKHDPRKALEVLFETEGSAYLYYGRGPGLFLLQGGYDKQGISYASYKVVYQEDLKHRKYQVKWYDYKPGIKYIDVIFNPETNRYENEDFYCE